MSKLNSRLMLAAVLAAALVAGCGGQSNDGGGASVDTTAEVGTSVTKTLAFIVALIAGNSENSDPVDINPITLAVDDTIDPIPL